MPADPIIAVKSNQSFYRITDRDLTFGDLVRVPLGANAIAVGPNSDYEIYEVIYQDPTDPENVRALTITPTRPFVGNLFANEAANYANTEETASLFVKVGGNGALTFPPRADLFAVNPLRRPPFLPEPDLLVYIGGTFTPGQALRSPRIYRGATAVPLTAGAPDENFISIPTFGRRTITIQLSPSVGTTPFPAINVKFWGVRAQYPLIANVAGQFVAPEIVRQELTPFIAYPIATSFSVNFFYHAEQEGRFSSQSVSPTVIDPFGRFDCIDIEIEPGADIEPDGQEMDIVLYYEGRD